MTDTGLRRRLRQFARNSGAMAGLLIVLVLVIIAVFAPQVSPYQPNAIAIHLRFQPPSSEHLFGTDNLGRDVLSRVIFATRISLLVGVVSVAISGVVGGLLGLLAGFAGGALDNLIMRLTDIQLSFPPLLVAVAVAAVLGPGLTNVIIVLTITQWAQYARLGRGSALKIRHLEYVQAAQALGSSRARILLRHVLPNALSPLVIMATLQLALVILTEASLSFLGLGVPPEVVTFGSMISASRDYLGIAWWFGVFPGIALMFLVLGFNFLGDGLNDLLDPKR